RARRGRQSRPRSPWRGRAGSRFQCSSTWPASTSPNQTRLTAESLGGFDRIGRLPGKPLLKPFDGIVAGEEFGIADQFLVERDGGLHSFDDEFLERPSQSHDAALAG